VLRIAVGSDMLDGQPEGSGAAFPYLKQAEN
jgi:hypothetical protein